MFSAQNGIKPPFCLFKSYSYLQMQFGNYLFTGHMNEYLGN